MEILRSTGIRMMSVLCLISISCVNSDNSGTRQMAERLRHLNENIDPVVNPYESGLRAEFIKSMEPPVIPTQRLRYDATLARELLYAGKTSEAVKLLEGIDAAFKARAELADPEFAYKIYTMLGISYLRLGEQQNCQLNHTSYSCILPIQEQAFHQLKQGSSKAIEIYSLILHQNPQDFASRWLLNVAYMTLGRYPHDVPPPCPVVVSSRILMVTAIRM